MLVCRAKPVLADHHRVLVGVQVRRRCPRHLLLRHRPRGRKVRHLARLASPWPRGLVRSHQRQTALPIAHCTMCCPLSPCVHGCPDTHEARPVRSGKLFAACSAAERASPSAASTRARAPGARVSARLLLPAVATSLSVGCTWARAPGARVSARLPLPAAASKRAARAHARGRGRWGPPHARGKLRRQGSIPRPGVGGCPRQTPPVPHLCRSSRQALLQTRPPIQAWRGAGPTL